MYRQPIIMSFFLLFSICAIAQRHEVLTEDINSLRVKTSQQGIGLPIISLNAEDYVDISFDVMSHDYRRYSYSIEHCEADWKKSDGIFDTDYLDGFTSGMIIEENEKSLNTAEIYTHYSLRIPNDECQLKMSGNYLLTIKDDDADEVVARVCFMVVEPKMSVSLNVTTRTDKDINGRYQQCEVKVGYSGLNVMMPEQQVKVYVLQNYRWSTARQLPRPMAFTSQGMEWYHCPNLLFPATNEYRKFEFLDLRRNTMGIEDTDYQGGKYIVNLYRDYPRPNYVYDEDANGGFVIRNFYDRNNDTESEYFLCNFSYHAPLPFDGEVYLNGIWTNDQLFPAYRMTYSPEEKCYRATVMLKMGYYSYQYLLKKPNGEVIYLPAEGNYFQTENHYSCLVYYRPQGGRTDLLYAVIK